MITLKAREQTTPIFSARLRDQNGDAISVDDLTTLTLTYYNKASGARINSRDGQDILNDNDVTVDSEGVVTWNMQVDDTPILDDVRFEEDHIALFRWTWSSGTMAGSAEITIKIQNIEGVT